MPLETANGLGRLFLIRHGDTDWSDSHKHTGRSDIPLNAGGEARAKLLEARLKNEKFTRVFSSPLMRALRTSQLAGFSGNAEINPDLFEWDYGDYEGLTTAEIEAKRPGWELFRDGAPNGESPEQVAARADHFVNLVRPIQGDVAAFSSGHMIRMIAARWLGLAPVNAKYFFTGTASVGVLGYEHTRQEPVILLWNDIRPMTGNA